MREQKYSHWRKQLTDIQGERKRVTKMKSFHSGYSDEEVRIKVFPFLSSQLVQFLLSVILAWFFSVGVALIENLENESHMGA